MSCGRLCRWTGSLVAAATLLLLVLSWVAFVGQADVLSAFTVLPIWIWGGLGVALGLLAWRCLRRRALLLLPGLWLVTVLALADECRSLARIGREPPRHGAAAAHAGRPVIRVLTLNRAYERMGNPSTDIIAYQPDIVLLQEAHAARVAELARALFGPDAHYKFYRELAVISRWEITRELRAPGFPHQQVTLRLPGGRQLEVVNVHLSSAETDLRLWRADSWRDHRTNRLMRRAQVAATLATLRDSSPFPQRPTLLGGDFNAPANDIIYTPIDACMVNSFSAVGSGWGNTFQRRIPILRIDQIFASSQLTPVRSRAATTAHSDHRMVVSDFLLAP
jgi:endonuclease/exonuclease/phosphatase (EEP) superfamily protein YafD